MDWPKYKSWEWPLPSSFLSPLWDTGCKKARIQASETESNGPVSCTWCMPARKSQCQKYKEYGRNSQEMELRSGRARVAESDNNGHFRNGLLINLPHLFALILGNIAPPMWRSLYLLLIYLCSGSDGCLGLPSFVRTLQRRPILWKSVGRTFRHNEVIWI